MEKEHPSMTVDILNRVIGNNNMDKDVKTQAEAKIKELIAKL